MVFHADMNICMTISITIFHESDQSNRLGWSVFIEVREIMYQCFPKVARVADHFNRVADQRPHFARPNDPLNLNGGRNRSEPVTNLVQLVYKCKGDNIMTVNLSRGSGGPPPEKKMDF